MDWAKVTVYTTTAGIEPVMGKLLGLGITGFETEDESEFDKFLEETKDSWDYVDEELDKRMRGETRVIVYVSEDASGHELLADIRGAMAELASYDKDGVFGRLAVETEETKTEDWANAWKKYFHTMDIGKRLRVQPYWEEDDGHTDRVVFKVNPGMSFGTGSHETTRLCLEALEKYVEPGCRMLDLGCGSGILSVVSLLLGAKEASAVDIDPNCVDTAYENADMNGIERERYHVRSGNVLGDAELQSFIGGDYDVVAANIVADVIIGLAPKAKEYMKDGGVFITSGIIDGRMDDVKKALESCGFEIEAAERRKDWWSFVCR